LTALSLLRSHAAHPILIGSTLLGEFSGPQFNLITIKHGDCGCKRCFLEAPSALGDAFVISASTSLVCKNMGRWMKTFWTALRLSSSITAITFARFSARLSLLLECRPELCPGRLLQVFSRQHGLSWHSDIYRGVSRPHQEKLPKTRSGFGAPHLVGQILTANSY
jgi:hypothetical protein